MHWRAEVKSIAMPILIALLAAGAVLTSLADNLPGYANYYPRIGTSGGFTWDPREERFTGEHSEEANRHLSRPRREGYALMG